MLNIFVKYAWPKKHMCLFYYACPGLSNEEFLVPLKFLKIQKESKFCKKNVTIWVSTLNCRSNKNQNCEIVNVATLH